MNQHFLKLLLSDICGTGVLMPWMWERTWLLKQLQRRRAERAREREREIKWTDAQATSRDNIFSVHRGVEMS